MRRLLATLTCAALLLINATEPVQARTTQDEAVWITLVRDQSSQSSLPIVPQNLPRIIASRSLAISRSPAGCKGQVHHAHTSEADIVYKGRLECRDYVDYKLEVWGDRHTWSGWRQHTDAHVIKQSYARSPQLRVSQPGRQGIYNYRTRVKLWTFEGGSTYVLGRNTRFAYHGAYGKSIRISCPGDGGRCNEVSAD